MKKMHLIDEFLQRERLKDRKIASCPFFQQMALSIGVTITYKSAMENVDSSFSDLPRGLAPW